MMSFNLTIRKLRFACLVLLSAVVLTGCSPKLDTSSKAAYEESMQNIGKNLDQAQKEQFVKIIMFYSLNKRPDQIFQFAASGNHEAVALVNLSELNGLTYDEILEKYKVDFAKFEAIILKERTEKEFSEVLNNKLKSHEFEEAYKMISSANKEILDAEFINKLKQSVDVSKKAYDEKREYFKRILVYNFVAERIDTYLEKNVPAIAYSIKNLGDKTVTDLTVKVFYRDSKGNVLLEKNYYPVYKKSFESETRAALKPGYIREPKKGYYNTLDQTLADWAPENTTLVIEDIEFDETATSSSAFSSNEPGNGNTEIKAKTKYKIKIDDYKDYVEISKFDARMIDTWLKRNVPGVRMEAKNLGNLTITRLETTVYYKNKQGQVIHEEKFYPVLVSEYVTRNTGPLEPCRTKSMKRDKYYVIEYNLENWDPKQTSYEITGIDFDRPGDEAYQKPEISKCK